MTPNHPPEKASLEELADHMERIANETMQLAAEVRRKAKQIGETNGRKSDDTATE